MKKLYRRAKVHFFNTGLIKLALDEQRKDVAIYDLAYEFCLGMNTAERLLNDFVECASCKQ